MSLLEDRILRIIELKRSKKDDMEIAQELGVLPSMVCEYEESVKGAFKKAFDQGYSDTIRLAKLIDISPVAVDIIMAYYDLTPSLPKRRQEITSSAGVRTAFAPFRGACAGDTPAIAEAIRLGQEFAGSLDELSRQLQLSKCHIREHAQKYGIKLRFEEDALFKKSSRKKQTKPIYARKGDLLKEIFDNPDGSELSLDELSRDLLTKEQQLEFLSTFDRYITQLAGQKGWAYQKAWQYLQRCRKSPHPLEMLVELFDTYDYAKLRNVALSLQELGEGVSLRWTSVSRILHTVGLNPLYGTKKMYKVPAQKKAALKRIASKKILPIKDLSYFLEIPSRAVEKIFAQRKIKVKPTIQKFWQEGKAVPLTYRSASQMYQARDLGFAAEEVAHLLDKPLPMIQYAYTHEENITSRIIQALKIIYPSEIITKPYRG